MTLIAEWSYRVPMGTDADGRPVVMSRAFFDFCSQVFTRVGGTSAPVLTSGMQPPPIFFDLESDNPPIVPGPPGLPGAAGSPGQVMLIEGEPGDDGMLLSASPVYRPITTPTRALNTTYTNTATTTLLVLATVRCAITLAAGNAYVQAKSDTATPPTVAASGIVGIQSGLLNEDNTFQVVFPVAPGATYDLISSATNGTVTLGNWFEIPI